jgi:hypothetical protein
MVDKTYLVTLKPSSRAIQYVVAPIVGVVETIRFFLGAKGNLSAVFLLDRVESWDVLPRWTAILHLLRGENSRSTVFAPHVSSLQGLSGGNGGRYPDE